MGIEFHCPGCGSLVGTPAEMAGRKGRCPQCGIKVRIPSHSLAGSSVPTRPDGSPLPAPMRSSSTAAKRWRSADDLPKPIWSAADPSKIEFICTSCRQRVKIVATAAGKMGQCPYCAAVIPIPRPSPGS